MFSQISKSAVESHLHIHYYKVYPTLTVRWWLPEAEGDNSEIIKGKILQWIVSHS